MHGLTLLDSEGQVIRPAILWNDGRSQVETDYLNNEIGKANLSKYTGNIAFAGFTAPKVMWVHKNEPENFAKIAKILLPKDYLAYRLSGVFATDVSDASGTLYFDCENRKWSDEMLKILDMKAEWLPEVFESYEAIGKILPEIADKLGINKDCVIAAGAGDNAAAAVGMGIIGNGGCNISLGTSGTIFIASSTFKNDEANSLHAFDHTQMADSTSWDACSQQLPATSGGWKRSSAQQIIPRNRKALRLSEPTKYSSCLISWARDHLSTTLTAALCS